jgi:hypothetical protein
MLMLKEIPRFPGVTPFTKPVPREKRGKATGVISQQKTRFCSIVLWPEEESN